MGRRSRMVPTPGLFFLAAALLLTTHVAATINSDYSLRKGILDANEKAKACKNKMNCFGTPVTVNVTSQITISSPLPVLKANAWLKVVGACGKGNCEINGKDTFKVFYTDPGFHTGPWAKLELSNLVFRNVKGGVLSNLWAEVTVKYCHFYENTGGVVIGSSDQGGFPPLYMQGCFFTGNLNGTIFFGSAKFGLAVGGSNSGITLKKCLFDESKATFSPAAVRLAGRGVSVFEDVEFLMEYNYGESSEGGAVYLDSTTATFNRCRFAFNQAKKGGAVAGRSYIYNPLTVRFYSCKFETNDASDSATDNLYFQSNPSYVRLYFFNTTTDGFVFDSRNSEDVLLTCKAPDMKDCKF